ncbi:MAG TPA: SDR family oxidoreductase [Paracoccaceae bacterium]|nr:SDR family oxidoreductase [Paracoccaceae bacterium]
MAPPRPIGRIGTPDGVADLVAWRLSDKASFVSGASIPVDGGFTAQQSGRTFGRGALFTRPSRRLDRTPRPSGATPRRRGGTAQAGRREHAARRAPAPTTARRHRTPSTAGGGDGSPCRARLRDPCRRP